jgi:hypothetical protein
MNFQQLLAKVLQTPAEGEAALIETLKSAGASEDAINVATANLRIQSGFKDKLSDEQFSEVAKAAGITVVDVEKAKKKKELGPDDENPFKPGFTMAGKKLKAAKSMPVDMPEEMRKAFDEQSEALEAVRKENEASAAKIVELEKSAKLKEYVAKCATSYSHVPGMSVEEMGDMLQKAYEVSEDFGKQLEKQWSSSATALKESALLKQQGATHSVHDGASAFGKMEAVAKELRAADPKLTQPQAMSKAMETHPELYAEYLAENPAQRGGR